METDAQATPAPAKRPGGGRRGDTRELGRVVRRYLGALEASRSSRGKRRTIEGISARLLKIDELLVSADPLVRLHMTQERIDLHAELVRITNGPDPDLSTYEKDFVRVAKQYGDVAGITYAAWRQVGVDTEVLEQAGIQRTGPVRPDASRVRRTAESGVGADDGAPLLPRTDPIPAAVPEAPVPEPAASEAPPVAAAPAPVTTVAPELALEPPARDVAPVKAGPKPAAAPKPPAAAKPRPPKKPRPAPAAKAESADAAPTPPHGDTLAGDDQPKLRRKRIAD
jgi:hypothetical protein